jgi:glycosyltransferase involved in cell wall biosynthesis
MPLVRVVITTYNRAQYLSEAVKSVLDQKHTEFELVIVNDGSTDNTEEVVNSFHDPSVHYVYQPNAGRSKARNRGLKNTDVDYIALLDDDDFYYPNKLSSQVDFLEKNLAVDLVVSGFNCIKKDGTFIDSWVPARKEPPLTLRNYLFRQKIITSSLLFRKKILDRLDHWFDPLLEPSEDADFFIRILSVINRAKWLPEIVSAYRLHGANSSITAYNRSFLKVLDKFFTGADVPADLLFKKASIYANVHLTAACRAYSCGQVPSAQFNIMRALMLDQRVLNDNFSNTVASYACYGKSNPQGYVDFVLNNLPAPVQDLYRFQDRIHELCKHKKKASEDLFVA